MSTKTGEAMSLRQMAEALQPGGCVEVESLTEAADSTGEIVAALAKIAGRGGDFVSRLDGIDTRAGQGEALFALCRALAARDRAALLDRQREGIERAREEGKYRGRKPIAVDWELFDSVVALWQSGQISARQAMERLELKPNTFYRRIKERKEQTMKDYKKVEHEIKSEIKEAARQSREELKELKKQVRSEAKELKKAADEKLELHDVERELRHDKMRAEIEHHDAVRQMKKDVEAEAKELKKLIGEND